jgi:hypothetical protein
MLQVFYLDVAKEDMVLHMLRWDPPVASACCSCWATVHARGKWKDGAGSGGGWRAAGARPISAYAGSWARAIPFVASSIGRLDLDNVTCWVGAASRRLLGFGHPDASVSLPKANGVKTLIPSHLSPRTKKIDGLIPLSKHKLG